MSNASRDAMAGAQTPTPGSAHPTGGPAGLRSSWQRVSAWREILRTNAIPEGKPLDVVGRWLLITRAAVFSMTVTSGLIGGLLAVATAPGDVNYTYLGLALVGLVAAHAANNMINDYFDTESGLDTPDYVRGLYGPHPILSGWVSKSGLRNAILAVNAIDVIIMVLLTIARGPLVVAFALAGGFISVFYVAPPIRLKYRGLGEPGVFLVWGPLMIGGTYFVTTGSIPGWIWLASLPYAILVTTVLLGKHVDKIEADTERGVRTLPVILGERRSKLLTATMMVTFYPIVVGMAAVGFVGPWLALVVFALPRLWQVLKIFARARPSAPPEGYPIWPLWFVAFAFIHTRRAGALLIVGLVLNIFLPVRLPWLGQG